MLDRTLNLKALASALALDAGLLSRYADTRGLPCSGDPGARRFNADEVREWLSAQNLGKRRNAADVRSSKKSSDVEPLALATDPLIIALKSGTSTSVEIANINLQLAARALANKAVAGEVAGSDFRSLKEATEENRQARDAAIEQAVREGQLIERVVAIEIIGTISGRLVQVGSNACMAFTQQLEIWLSDAAFMAQPVESRRRSALDWLANQFAAVRLLACDDVEALLKSALQTSATISDEVPA